MPKTYQCETCHDTGWTGDNGPGIKGNRYYHPCECKWGKAIEKRMSEKAVWHGWVRSGVLLNEIFRWEQDLGQRRTLANQWLIFQEKSENLDHDRRVRLTAEWEEDNDGKG